MADGRVQSLRLESVQRHEAKTSVPWPGSTIPGASRPARLPAPPSRTAPDPGQCHHSVITDFDQNRGPVVLDRSVTCASVRSQVDVDHVALRHVWSRWLAPPEPSIEDELDLRTQSSAHARYVDLIRQPFGSGIAGTTHQALRPARDRRVRAGEARAQGDGPLPSRPPSIPRAYRQCSGSEHHRTISAR